MVAKKATYPEFVVNQVLTNTQLNQLRDYLDEQDRFGRIRLIGMGKVCGLNYRVDSATHAITISAGFGITSHGYVIELQGAETEEIESSGVTYTHFREEYTDPAPPDGQPPYAPWRKPTGEQIPIRELLAEDNGNPLAADTGTGHVLVLYLEKKPEPRKSCIVTECDNKGLDIDHRVRALLVPIAHLQSIPGCGPAPELISVPRLHTKIALTDIHKEGDIHGAYSDIITDTVPTLIENIIAAFEQYGVFLGIDQDTLEEVVSAAEQAKDMLEAGGEAYQIHYDALKDLAAAYNEFVTAACGLIGCIAHADFPRHLMLASLDGQPGYCHEFMPSPVRNVMNGDLERIRRLLLRILAMMKALVFDEGSDLRITPSHTERHALGERAVPRHLQLSAALKATWQPHLCCTTDRLWSYQESTTRLDLDYDYNRCSFLRIEGHVRKDAQTAYNTLESLRGQRNLAFDVLLTHLRYVDNSEDIQKNLQKIESLRRESFIKLKEELSKFPEKIVVGKRIAEFNALDKRLRHENGNWISARSARKLFCSVSHLQVDYLAMRSEIQCGLHHLSGSLAKLLTNIERWRVWIDSLMKTYGIEAKELLLDSVAAAMGTRGLHSERVIKSIEDFLANLKEKSATERFVFAVVLSLHTLHEDIQALLINRLPKDLEAFNCDLFMEQYEALAREMTHFMLLWSMVVPLSDRSSDLQMRGEWVEWTITGELRAMLSRCSHIGLLSFCHVYEWVRQNDLSLFENLARQASGLEHLGGVEEGDTFVLVCDSDVVADFTLPGSLFCCCQLKADTICLPPVALPDYRVVILAGEGEESERPVRIMIDVLANDWNPNLRTSSGNKTLEISLPNTKSEYGANLEIVESSNVGFEPFSNRVVIYTHENPRPGLIDRFSYDLGLKDEKCEGNATGEVFVLMMPEIMPLTGTISGTVFFVQEGGELMPKAKVEITETGTHIIADERARYSFTGLSPGTYTLRASREGMTSGAERVSLMTGELVTKNLYIMPAS
jgi:hypothetical protein